MGGRIFLTVREENHKYRKEKNKNEPMVLDWNWRYLCEFMVFNIGEWLNRQTDDIKIQVCMCMYVYMYIYAYIF